MAQRLKRGEEDRVIVSGAALLGASVFLFGLVFGFGHIVLGFLGVYPVCQLTALRTTDEVLGKCGVFNV